VSGFLIAMLIATACIAALVCIGWAIRHAVRRANQLLKELEIEQ